MLFPDVYALVEFGYATGAYYNIWRSFSRSRQSGSGWLAQKIEGAAARRNSIPIHHRADVTFPIGHIDAAGRTVCRPHKTDEAYRSAVVQAEVEVHSEECAAVRRRCAWEDYRSQGPCMVRVAKQAAVDKRIKLERVQRETWQDGFLAGRVENRR